MQILPGRVEMLNQVSSKQPRAVSAFYFGLNILSIYFFFFLPVLGEVVAPGHVASAIYACSSLRMNGLGAEYCAYTALKYTVASPQKFRSLNSS